MIEFSIVLSSRERVGLLRNLLNSINDTTRNKDKVEVLVAIDYDDRATLDALPELNQMPMVKFELRERSEKLNEDYLNWLYRECSQGKYLIVCNDDCLFKTPDWDNIATHRLDAYLADKPDGVAYGWISDSLVRREYNMNYCCFPLISRNGADALKFLLHGQFYSWGADISIWRVYNEVNRICNISDMLIDHVSHHAGKRERDGVSFRVEEISKKSMLDPCKMDIGNDVRKLARYIERCKRK